MVWIIGWGSLPHSHLPQAQLLGTPGKLRPAEPLVKPYVQGSQAKVKEVEEDNQAFARAMLEFQAYKHAASNQATHAARAKWWASRAEARKPIDLRKLTNVKEVEGPQGIRSMAVLFSLFACREVEASVRLVKQVKIDPGVGCGKVSILLPCSCKTCPELCPVIAAPELLTIAEKNGHGPEDPLLVCPSFQVCGQSGGLHRHLCQPDYRPHLEALRGTAHGEVGS